jgi:hypothetical protein
MKSASRFLVVSMAILSAAGLASDALARGGHRGGRMGGNTCLRVGFESHEARAIRRTSSMTDAA